MAEDIATTVWLTPENAEFGRSTGGFLRLVRSADAGEGDGAPPRTYARVLAYRAFPLSDPGEYIVVRESAEMDKGAEIGIVRRLADFPREQAMAVEEELRRRYFTPRIASVQDLKEEYGFVTWKATTDAGPVKFSSRVDSTGIIPLGPRRFMIVDLDGNRYEIADLERLDAASRRRLDMFL
jgi:hypothetical protein